MRFPNPQLVLGLLAAPLAVVVATCGNSTPPQGARAPGSTQATEGAKVYEKYCALCHGKQGEGYAADNANALANPELLATASDSFLRVAIARGRVDTPMSAWAKQYGGPLSNAEIESLVKLIRGWQSTPSLQLPNTRVAGDQLRGGKLYAEHCASCHGPRGEGKLAPTLDNPVFHSTVSDHFIRFAIERGRTGTPMPPFVGTLDQQGLDDVTTFVRGLRRHATRKVAAKLPDVPLVINPKGPAPKFTLREDFYVPVDQVKQALDAGARLVIADARAQSDYLEAHLPGAISLPFYAIDEYADKLPKDGTWIVAYCACPHAASGRVARGLRDRGFKNTAVLDEGVLVWMQRNYPVQRVEAEP